MFDDFDTQIQFDELAALNSIYWEIDNPADWENLGEKDEGEEQGGSDNFITQTKSSDRNYITWEDFFLFYQELSEKNEQKFIYIDAYDGSIL